MIRNAKWLIIIIASMFVCVSADAQRKRVAVVLSGGGAKGVAHVGALKVLEEAGIPVDYIVGTSMGSIIGGLYAIGHSAAQLDSLVQAQNWEFLLSDKVYRYDLPFTEKENDGKYLLSISFDLRNMKKGQRGFVSGQNVYNLFSDLTVGYHDSLDFSRLPIPFACVAADMVNREEVVFHGGNLVQAMRASMAIPGAFTPVRIGDKVLVDGGVLNNFPVDVARAMGAEVVIGVDVQADLMKAEQLGSVSTVMAQMINLMCMNKYRENLARADLVIRPNVKGYSSASFSDRAIDTLLVRGEAAARKKWDELIALREYIGGTRESLPLDRREPPEEFMVRNIYIRGVEGKEKEAVEHRLRLKENSLVSMKDIHRTIAELYGTKAYAAVNYRLLGTKAPFDLELALMPQSSGTINVGFRFDSEEMASILLNTTYRRGALRGGQLSLTGSLSRNPSFRVEYSLENTFLRRFNLAYTFRYNDVNFYRKGEKVNNITYRYHAGDLGASNLYFRNLRFGGGIRYEFFDYNSLLFVYEGDIVNIRPEGLFSYYGLVHWETLDRRFYPAEGSLVRVDYSLFTDNLLTYDGRAPFSALSWKAMTVFPVTDRFSLLPACHGRILIGHDPANPAVNCVGGTEFGRYCQQQLPFAGINHVEVFDNTVVIAKLQLRQRMGSKHYLSLVGNYALQSDDFFDILKHRGIWGGALGYSRDSRVGPIDLSVSLSDWNKKLEYYFNFGFYF